MLLKIPKERLDAYLRDNEDCEALSEDEYVADLYDIEPPITVNFRLTAKGVEVLAAARLLYDEEQDGWYMGERIEDEEGLTQAFLRAMELSGV